MAAPLTAQVAESRCRQRVSDVDVDIWSIDQMMAGLDDSLNSIWTMVRTRGRDHILERADVAIGSFTLEADNRYSYTPPDIWGAIRKIEGMQGTRVAAEIPQAGLDFKEVGQWGGTPVWFRSQSGTITLIANISRLSAVRVWFQRRWPPMHYGVTSGVGTTSTMVFSTATDQGRIVRRDVYTGTDVELIGGSLADTIVRITAFNPATLTATFTPTLAAPVGAAQAYSLVVPVNPEHGEYVVEEMAARFLERSGNINYTMAKAERLMRLREEFLRDLTHRDQDAPDQLYNSRSF